jgi:hypothetical protein
VRDTGRATGGGSGGAAGGHNGGACGGEEISSGVQRIESDDRTRSGGIQDSRLAADVAEVDRDVVGESRGAVKGEISGKKTFQIDFIARLVLCGSDSWDIDSGISVGGLRETGTIISCVAVVCSGSAPDVGTADLRGRERDRGGGLPARCVVLRGGDQAEVVVGGEDSLRANGVAVYGVPDRAQWAGDRGGDG